MFVINQCYKHGDSQCLSCQTSFGFRTSPRRPQRLQGTQKKNHAGSTDPTMAEVQHTSSFMQVLLTVFVREKGTSDSWTDQANKTHQQGFSPTHTVVGQI
jgi:hypothetical protein